VKRKDGGTTDGRRIINRNTRSGHGQTTSWNEAIRIASKTIVVEGEVFSATIDTGIDETTQNEGRPGTRRDEERHCSMSSESIILGWPGEAPSSLQNQCITRPFDLMRLRRSQHPSRNLESWPEDNPNPSVIYYKSKFDQIYSRPTITVYKEVEDH
jgi:hypothetical protein